MRNTLSFTAVLFSLGAFGCGDGGGADSRPTDALRAMTGSMKKGDREAFLDKLAAAGISTYEARLGDRVIVYEGHGQSYAESIYR